eukprot:7107660-Alexandrium_andersonii.AAC.1
MLCLRQSRPNSGIVEQPRHDERLHRQMLLLGRHETGTEHARAQGMILLHAFSRAMSDLTSQGPGRANDRAKVTILLHDREGEVGAVNAQQCPGEGSRH